MFSFFEINFLCLRYIIVDFYHLMKLRSGLDNLNNYINVAFPLGREVFLA